MKMWIRNPFAFAALAAAVSLAACSSDNNVTGDDDDDDPPLSGLVEIELTEANRFVQDDVTIEPGTTVRWTNVSDVVSHTVTPNDDDQAGVWVRKEMPPGEVFEHTFNIADQVYDYFCEPHLADDMVGTITVAEE